MCYIDVAAECEAVLAKKENCRGEIAKKTDQNEQKIILHVRHGECAE
jgi:hypothetical protein